MSDYIFEVINRKHFEKFYQGMEDVLPDLAEKILEVIPKKLDEIKSANNSNESEKLKNSCTSLKEALMEYYANRPVELLEKINGLASTGDSKRVGKALEELEEVLGTFKQELEIIVQENSVS